MSTWIKGFAAAILFGSLAACAQQGEVEEFILVEPEPISAEPDFNGKYG